MSTVGWCYTLTASITRPVILGQYPAKLVRNLNEALRLGRSQRLMSIDFVMKDCA